MIRRSSRSIRTVSFAIVALVSAALMGCSDDARPDQPPSPNTVPDGTDSNTTAPGNTVVLDDPTGEQPQNSAGQPSTGSSLGD